ncbi:MAG TPA: ABC transporter ATP-binding protein [Candidatus Saccharimonadales bacterium]
MNPPAAKKPGRPASADDLVTVKGLNKQFDLKSGPVEVLHDINFRIPQKSLAIIFGPSGSGKSTLLNILSGLEMPSKGTVTIGGQDVYALNNDQRAHFRAQIMGIVHQQNYWIKSLNVLENVAMPLYLTGSPKSSALTVALDSLGKVGMTEYAHYLPTVLSGGQQQRVSMARALVASPQLILADEPTGNLDSKNGQKIIDLLLYFQQKLDRTIVLVTHNIEYLPLSDTQLFIRDGRITESQRGQKMPAEIVDSLKAQISDLTKMEHNS